MGLSASTWPTLQSGLARYSGQLGLGVGRERAYVWWALGAHTRPNTGMHSTGSDLSSRRGIGQPWALWHERCDRAGDECSSESSVRGHRPKMNAPVSTRNWLQGALGDPGVDTTDARSVHRVRGLDSSRKFEKSPRITPRNPRGWFFFPAFLGGLPTRVFGLEGFDPTIGLIRNLRHPRWSFDGTSFEPSLCPFVVCLFGLSVIWLCRVPRQCPEIISFIDHFDRAFDGRHIDHAFFVYQVLLFSERKIDIIRHRFCWSFAQSFY